MDVPPIAARANFVPGAYRSDITIANWPQLDCETGEPDDARELSLSFLHWLQAEQGLPGLRLRGDVTGTPDGLAKDLYVRESRRILAEYTIVEHELGARHPDSVGIGSYRIDLHPRTGGEGYLDIDAPPFEIPLGALVPVRMENLLPGAKNLGTTHITNGCLACIRSNGTSARPPARWPPSASGRGAGRARCARAPRCATPTATSSPATGSSCRGRPPSSGRRLSAG